MTVRLLQQLNLTGQGKIGYFTTGTLYYFTPVYPPSPLWG